MERHLDDDIIESIIIKGAITNKEYLALLMNSFDSDFFDNPEYKKIYEFTIDYYKNNLDIPDFFILKNVIKESNIWDNIESVDFDVIKNYKFLITETNLYLKEKSIKQAILDSVDVIDRKKDTKEIREIISKALSKDLLINLGLNYWDTLGSRLKEIIVSNDKKIPTYYPMLDEFINGGLIPYSLSLFLSRIHGFKCVGGNTMIQVRNTNTKKIYNTRIKEFFYYLINNNKEEEHKLKLDDMVSKSSKNRNILPYFIKKYGEKKGTDQYNLYIERQKFSQSIDGYIEKYGKEEGTKKWNKRIVKQ